LKEAAASISAPGLFEAAGTLERIGDEGRVELAQAAWLRLYMEAMRVTDTLRQFETTADRATLACAS
jgi:hypothetical protein